MITKKSRNRNLRIYIFVCGFALCVMRYAVCGYTQEVKNDTEEPIVVNGDKLEYSMDGREVTVTGNVNVTYKGTLLTCDKLTMNQQTKDAIAEGNARLDDKQGVIEGPKITYNFNTKTGIISDAEFRANPYFGKSKKVDRVSEQEFIARRGYITTCSYDMPHYRIVSKKVNFFPGDKVQTRNDLFILGQVPLLYIPQYNHSLKEPYMHVQLMPGKSKQWGAFLLSAWRYKLTEHIDGRIYLDYREKLGAAEGFGANYTFPQFGRGDFKYYYTQERSIFFEEGVPAEFQRHFIRLRHQWDISERTNLISEYFKIVDSKRMIHGTEHNVLKDYFSREYEKDTTPLSYALLHHSFNYSSLDILMQKRINRWYTQEENLPEIKYTLPSSRIGESPFYLENATSFLNYNNKNAVPSPSWNDTTYNKFDTSNKFSLPAKIAFISFSPFISGQWVYLDKNSTYGSTAQVIASTGTDMSTKFYRLFNVQSNFLGLDINGLRHIITPTATYSYSKTSTMPSSKAKFGGGSTATSTSVGLELSNKLQTKRKNDKVDIADLKVNTSYIINPESGDKIGSNFSDILFDLELLPYSWLRLTADTTYKHSGNRYTGQDYNHISQTNYDINFSFDEEHSFGFGQRWVRKSSNQLTYNFIWRFSPKWKFSLYHRRERGHTPGLKRGLREQEYVISRDLHCWTVEFTYNRKVGEGDSVWLIFRLKAFPELEFEYNQSYHSPKPGTQSNP